MSNKKAEPRIRMQAGKIILLAGLLDIQLGNLYDNFYFYSNILFLISFFCSLNHNSKRLIGRKFSKIGTQAYSIYRNIFKLIWVSLVLAWVISTEVIEYIILYRENIYTPKKES